MAKQPRSLSGKVVVITGGGRGIGAATVSALVAHGAKVVIGDIDQASAEETAQRLDKEPIALQVDVTDPEAFTAFLDEAQRRAGPIDVLINNAGIMPLGPADEEPTGTARKQLEINLFAVIHGTKEAMRRMKARRRGHIVNIASIAGVGGFPGGATYCATKHGVVGFSDAVARELRGTGVDIAVVLPGIVRTELASGLGEAKLVKSVAPEEVAAAIVRVLQFPRFDVFVPGFAGALLKLPRALPRGFTDWMARALKADQLLAGGAHSAERTAYEQRVRG
ncbi:SDR family oxidoreductase [Sciscionella marina]|uniref:SDR family oxidoreductase n=1 Tax=Sciscionella marina TaxID=508770 RepID=UPI000377D837|nr:SDR family oxidoreductase [Sciscionella marina]